MDILVLDTPLNEAAHYETASELGSDPHTEVLVDVADDYMATPRENAAFMLLLLAIILFGTLSIGWIAFT